MSSESHHLAIHAATEAPPHAHGGDLRSAARAYRIPLSDWLDLSTGINPRSWPVPELGPSAWQRLPEDDDDLPSAAAAYYRSPHLLPVAGSQAAILALPGLRSPCRVVIPEPTYSEHAQAWANAGHNVVRVPWETLTAAAKAQDQPRLPPVLANADVVVLVQPNNPTGTRLPQAVLSAWQQALAAGGGWLVIDEAFMDATPVYSLIQPEPPAGLIVLRSLGKFFGLAGARVGFVWAAPELLRRLQARLGPWTVSGPARQVARLALSDTAWIATTRETLASSGERLADLLAANGLAPHGGTGLFQWVITARAQAWQAALARQGIWVRRFSQPASLRFGMPGSEAAWDWLAGALASIRSG